jgi:hypothetical protein
VEDTLFFYRGAGVFGFSQNWEYENKWMYPNEGVCSIPDMYNYTPEEGERVTVFLDPEDAERSCSLGELREALDNYYNLAADPAATDDEIAAAWARLVSLFPSEEDARAFYNQP